MIWRMRRLNHVFVSCGCCNDIIMAFIFRTNGLVLSSSSYNPSTTVNIIVGSHVWVEDPGEAWIDGTVTKITGQEAEIKTFSLKKVVAKLSNVFPKDMEAPAGGVDDMTKLSYLHEPGVLLADWVEKKCSHKSKLSLKVFLHHLLDHPNTNCQYLNNLQEFFGQLLDILM